MFPNIKQSNFVIPTKPGWARQLYIVDFGLSKEIANYGDDTSFGGTSLYASLRAHDNQRVRRVDDLWSMFYLIIDISTNRLPWKDDYQTIDTKQRRSVIRDEKLKFETNMQNFPRYLPREYKNIATLLNNGVKRCNPPDNDQIDAKLYENIIDELKNVFLNDEYTKLQFDLDCTLNTYAYIFVRYLYVLLCFTTDISFVFVPPFLFYV